MSEAVESVFQMARVFMKNYGSMPHTITLSEELYVKFCSELFPSKYFNDIENKRQMEIFTVYGSILIVNERYKDE